MPKPNQRHTPTPPFPTPVVPASPLPTRRALAAMTRSSSRESPARPSPVLERRLTRQASREAGIAYQSPQTERRLTRQASSSVKDSPRLLQRTVSKEVEALGTRLKGQKLQRQQSQMGEGDLEEYQLPVLITRLREAVIRENLGKVRMDDDFLTIFIRVRDYNLERALRSVRNYYSNIRHNYERFRGTRPSQFLSVYEDRIIVVFKYPCNLGSTVSLIRVKSWDPTKHSIRALLNSSFFLVQDAIQSLQTQLQGITLIFDLQNLSFSQLRQLTAKELKLLVTCGQDGLPLRIVGVHFINYPSIFWGAYYIAQGFMKEKLRKRIHFHSNLASLHTHFHVGSIPTCIGGGLELDDALDKDLVDRVLKNDKEIEGKC